MKQSIWHPTVLGRTGTASDGCSPPQGIAIVLRSALATAVLLGAASAAPAQQEPGRSDCLQDKKLEVANPRSEELLYGNLRNRQNLTESDKQIIDHVVKFYVYRLSWPEERKKLNRNREDLLEAANGAPSEAFRREVRKGLLKYARDLFDNQCVVRMAGALLLAEIEDPADLESGVALLIGELNKPQQDELVKLHACRGIERLASVGFRRVQLRNDAITALVSFLGGNEPLHPPTRVRAIEAIRAIAARSEQADAVRQDELLPAVQVLLQIVHQPDAQPSVRVTAAEAIGALDVSKLSDKLNYALVAHEIAALAASLGKDYVERFDELQQTEDVYDWQYHFAQLVKSFRGDHRETGLLRMAAADPDQLKTVQQAETRVVAITKAVLAFADTDDIKKLVDDLQVWVEQNAPTDRRLAPRLPELAAAAPAAGQ